MLKWVKLDGDRVTEMGLSNNDSFYESQGFIVADVEESVKGGWYIVGKAPTYTEEEIFQQRLIKAKEERADYVSKIIVIVDGLPFDGDETSQDRMARSIVALNDGETVQWVLANNTPTQVTKEQLRTALRLAGEEQTAIWAKPYTI